MLSGDGKKEFLSRDELRQALQKTGARLKVLITETGGEFIDLPAPKPAPEIDPKEESEETQACAPVTKAGRGPRPVYRKMFLEARGFVDINGAAEGLSAWYSAARGGSFSRALGASLDHFHDDQAASWTRFYADLHERADRMYKEWRLETLKEFEPRLDSLSRVEREIVEALKKQLSQPPQLFDLPGLTLGLVGKWTSGNGVDVVGLTRTSRAQEAGLRVGDRIVAVNETKVRRVKEFDRVIDPLLAQGRAEVALTVRRQGKEEKINVALTSP
jgi:hypothetical protein